MEIRKPVLPRVYVVVRNPLTGKSRTMTFYNTDEVRCSNYIRRVMEGNRKVAAVGAGSVGEAEATSR